MKKTTKQLFIGLLLLPVAVISAPAPAPDGGFGATLQNQIEKQLPPANALPKASPKEKKEQAPQKKPGEATVQVKVFKVEGATQVSMEEIQAVLEPWINQFLTLDQIQEAADAVTKLYTDKGLLAQVVIPPQKIVAEEGVVILRVIEAKLGGVRVDFNGQSVRMSEERIAKYITNANPLGELVNTDAIERGVLILREVPGISVATEMEPGANDGEVSLHLITSETPFLTGSVGASNYGSAATGKYQGIAGLNLNNLSGIGDALRLNAAYTQGSTLGQLSYSFPLSPSGWVLGFSTSAMSYSTVGDFAGSEGKSHTLGTNLTYPIMRSQTTNLNFSVAYDMKFFKNNTTAGLLVSDYKINDLTISVNGNNFDNFLGGGVTTASLGWVRGLWTSNTWDPTITTNYGQYNPRNYGKLTYAVQRNQQIYQDSTVLNIGLTGQFAFNNLDGGEKFYLGGPTAVRAYPTSQGGGDTGGVLTLELQHSISEGLVGTVFFDGGFVKQYQTQTTYDTLVAANTTNANNIYFLSGAGVGVKYAIEKLNLNASLAWPIGINPLYKYSSSASAYVRQNGDNTSGHPYFWIQGTYSF